MPGVFSYHTITVGFVWNEYSTVKISVLVQFATSNYVIGWDMRNEVTSKFKCKFCKQPVLPDFKVIDKIGDCTPLIMINSFWLSDAYMR